MQKYYQTTLRLWKLLKPFHFDFYLQLFYIVMAQLLGIFMVVMLSKSLNSIVNKDFIIATYFVTAFFIISCAQAFSGYFKDRHATKNINLSILQFLQEFTLKNIFKLNPSQFLEDHSAIKLQVVQRGEEAIQNIITTIILNLLPTVTQVTFALIAIAFYSPIVATVALGSLIIVVIWTNKFSNFHRPYIKKNIDIWDVQRRVRTEGFQHLTLIKTSGVEDNYLKKYLENRSKVLEHSILMRLLQNSHNVKRWTFFNFSNWLNRLLLVYNAFLSKLAVGDIYAIWTWISDANNNIFNVINAMKQIPINFVELEKYLDIIDKSPVFKETGLKKFEMGDIVFQDMSFKYPKSEGDVIDNLNLTVEQGKKTAFVGFSGSGKSTIIKLLLRIYDWNGGDIKLGGVSLRKLDAQTLRQKIGYVEQHVDLFDISIKENILFGIPSGRLSQEKLDEVVYKSRIEEFFHRLGTAGLDTVIGERGVKLSGGERQRIGIARALAKDPEILIFDEATASLDTENEKYIQEAIDESSKGRTTIIIAHRLSTIQNADKIFVMDKGVIVCEGTHESLLATNKHYQRLVHAQNS